MQYDPDLSPSEDDDSPFSSLSVRTDDNDAKEDAEETEQKSVDAAKNPRTVVRSSSEKSNVSTLRHDDEEDEKGSSFASRRADKRFKTLPAKLNSEKVRINRHLKLTKEVINVTISVSIFARTL